MTLAPCLDFLPDFLKPSQSYLRKGAKLLLSTIFVRVLGIMVGIRLAGLALLLELFGRKMFTEIFFLVELNIMRPLGLIVVHYDVTKRLCARGKHGFVGHPWVLCHQKCALGHLFLVPNIIADGLGCKHERKK